MAKSYTEVDLDIIALLRAKGFKSIELVLQPSNGTMQATVEVVPQKEHNLRLEQISLTSSELMHYFEGRSPMAKYVIDQDYLNRSGV